MEDFFIDVIIGKGEEARSIRIDLPPFTLVGATTRFGSLSAPLRDRFGVQLRLEYYDVDSLITIVERTSEIFNVEIDPRSEERRVGKSVEMWGGRMWRRDE